MENEIYKVVGVMSGTSLDGVDIIYTELRFNNGWDYQIKLGETYSYPPEWQKLLADAIHTSKEEVEKLDVSYTKYLGILIKQFITENNLVDIDMVCSHGHTIFHDPDNGYTKQIGNLQEIAAYIGCTVVCDFRVQDVAMGGQGAPLVPIGDQLLFNNYNYCLNLGGFANISFEENGKRLAFDVCPVNIVMNYYTRKIGLEYDDGGALAKSGKVHAGLLVALNELPFYQQSYPKSLGLEWVQKEVFPIIDSFQLTVPDILRTFVQHIVEQVSRVVKKDASMLVTGGGAYNLFLMSLMVTEAQVKVAPVDEKLIEFKEALVFAFLGVLKVRGEVNCLSSVTGALKDHSSGVVFNP
ncbi:anhydro-N-acetylmuramic acid kinase [Neptunitalea lumnitzerae]|uniref:Anhydro-N-acetylmuramic acid kinase n=1 Tax=Neptunitalea lumnitzerae TaxID=2965509 RepID=A0ABQ5ME36_9FLAO|nr:anhydro-N-acetylmuramic acid kinase [Neptunitalea sp. Y10]GLB47639.1 anhydro-N-acetylmuramic acid kinase [Neptunitalea sp. Y10]